MIKFSYEDLHGHLKKRMEQRGITLEEIEYTLNNGWGIEEAREGTHGKVYVFYYNKEWEGKLYKEKEVKVFYKMENDRIIVLTAIVRYGEKFEKGGSL